MHRDPLDVPWVPYPKSSTPTFPMLPKDLNTLDNRLQGQGTMRSTERWSAKWITLAMTLLVIGCSEDDRVVPFGQGGSHQGEGEEQEGEPEGPPPSADIRPSEGLEGVQAVPLHDTQLQMEGIRFYAALREDMDQDGDDDVLAVGVSDGHSEGDPPIAHLVFGRQERPAEGETTSPRVVAETLGMHPFPPGAASGTGDTECEPPLAVIHTDGSRRVAEFTRTCGTSTVRVYFLVQADHTPRLRERLGVQDGQLTLAYPDIDDDGHPDLEATVHLAGRELTLRWMDRAGGLALDPRQPAETLEAVSGDPGAIDFASAICGEGLAIGGHWGLDCPPDTRRRLTLEALFAQASDNLAQALAGMPELSAEEEAAFLTRIERPTIHALRVGPPLRAHLAARQGGLGYGPEGVIDHTRAHILAVPPQAGVQPLPYTGPPAIPSPSAPPRAVGGVRSRIHRTLIRRGQQNRRMRAHARQPARIEIFPAQLFAPGSTAIESIPIDAAARTRWTVLGWAPQGFLLFDGVSRHFMEVTSTPLRTHLVPVPTPMPAPLRGARVAQGGRVWVSETPLGVIHGDGETVSLWRNEDWDRQHPILAAAIDPTGTRIAIARDDGIFVLHQENDTAVRPVPSETTNQPAPSSDATGDAVEDPANGAASPEPSSADSNPSDEAPADNPSSAMQ